MGIGWLVLIFFGGLLLFFFLLGMFTAGTGADLVDWDPSKRQEGKRVTEREDMEEQLAVVNRRRRAMGLDELDEHGVIDGLQTDRDREQLD